MRHVSVTFSPIHLAFPVFEVAGEFAITPKMSAAVIAGYGSVPLQDTKGKTIERLTAWEAGAHFNYYVIGTFEHGMQLGLEALYLKIANSSIGDAQLSGSAAGLAIGPYAGYKVIAGFGLTFEANLGVQYVTARAKVSSSTESATASERRFIPLLNLNLGWSF